MSKISKEKWVWNKTRGDMAESLFANSVRETGRTPIRTGRGSDYSVDGNLFEIKSGRAQPTSLQQKGINSGKVKVVRYKDFSDPFNEE